MFNNNIKNISIRKVKQIVNSLVKYIKEDRRHVYSIVALSRGGLVPARYIAEYLGVRRIHTLGMEFYESDCNAMDIRTRKPFIYQAVTADFSTVLQPCCVLIVDDIVDSGESMILAKKHVQGCKAANIITCSLHFKQKSTFIPDYYGDIVPNETWVKYDWE